MARGSGGVGEVAFGAGIGAIVTTVGTVGLSPLVAVPCVTLVAVAAVAWGRRYAVAELAARPRGRRP